MLKKIETMLKKAEKEDKLKEFILGQDTYPYAVKINNNDPYFRYGGHFWPVGQKYIKDNNSERFYRFLALKELLNKPQNSELARKLVFDLISEASCISSSALRDLNSNNRFVDVNEIIKFALKKGKLEDYTKARNGYPFIGDKDEKSNLYYLREFYNRTTNQNKKKIEEFLHKIYHKKIDELTEKDE